MKSLDAARPRSPSDHFAGIIRRGLHEQGTYGQSERAEETNQAAKSQRGNRRISE